MYRHSDEVTTSTINEFLDRLVKIERHEDKMITSMVRLIESTEKLNRRIEGLTWIMLVLTAITFIISIPNTVATIMGIPRVSDIVSVEIILLSITLSAIVPVLLIFYPRWLIAKWWGKLEKTLKEE
ncbi:hypothetical protein KEJ51_05145 [Candidatus Bathyarchaeota archaeon]|nr:hypothetical protein [Candidatus Bathyarchaeota archaeon]MBS7629058.1 hypothetical protein [Candidatus Bathyarchaeota archaeon]